MDDLIGLTFGRLTVISKAETRKTPNGSRRTYWVCKCNCGNVKEICEYSLKRGLTVSCGCYRKEKSPLNGIKHGMARSRLYNIWKHMKSRCYNPNIKNYKDYGGRGISICNEWVENFECFYTWAIKNGYSEELSIDRIDVNGNYSPSNCRWTDRVGQQNNKRNNRILEYGGEKMTMAQLSRKFGISRSKIEKSIKKGLSVDEIVSREGWHD